MADPLRLLPRLAPFERLPYLQAVDTISAAVRWLAREDATGRFEYRLDGDTAWREATVLVTDSGVAGQTGPVATRTVRLTGLSPGEEVSYRAWENEVLVGPFTFRAAPRPSDQDTIRVLAFGDSGWGSAEQVRLADEMGVDYDLAVHTGDIAYHVGSEVDFTLRHFQVYRSLLARTPFFPAVGNHDLRSEGGAPYARAFEWSAPDSGARYYSYRWGGVVFIALDTTDELEADFPGSPAPRTAEGEIYTDGAELRDGVGRQYSWLERTLASASSAPSTRWIIVYMHHPPWSSAAGLSGHGSDVPLRRKLAPLFQRYGVDLVLSGHDHHFERSLPLVDQRIVAEGCGPVYIVTGGGGATRYARGIAPSPLAAVSAREYHFVRLEIAGSQINGEVIDDVGGAIDRFRVLPFDGMDEDGGWLRLSCGD